MSEVSSKVFFVDFSGSYTPRQIGALIGLGLLAGLLTGLFGVGGGTIVLPGLMLVLRIEHKIAVGTSLMTIIPASAIGIILYAAHGSIDWGAGAIVAVGAVVGAQLGARLLGVLSRKAAQWAFIIFSVVIIIQLLITSPHRVAVMTWGVWQVFVLLALGLVAGFAAGLLGIGGGVIVVPAMMVIFGVADVVAKGVSLLVMLPGASSVFIGKVRGPGILAKPGLIVGLAAGLTVPFGVLIAHVIHPRIANTLFAAYLAFVVAMMISEMVNPSTTRLESTFHQNQHLAA